MLKFVILLKKTNYKVELKQTSDDQGKEIYRHKCAYDVIKL